MDASGYHHPSLAHHHRVPSHHRATNYCPPSPASSCNSSDNSNDRLPPFKPGLAIQNLSNHPFAGHPYQTSPNSNANSNPAPSSSSPPEPGIYSVHGAGDPAAFQSDYAPQASSSSAYHARRSPPPEPTYPTGTPGQQPAAWTDFAYVPSASSQNRSPPRPLEPAATISSTHQGSSSSGAPWPRQPTPPPDDPNSQVDQLFDLEDAPPAAPVISPPQSPPPAPGSTGSIRLTAPSTTHTAYRPPQLHYPISPPGNDQQSSSSKTYSFVSLPGNAMRKRPRRKYDEIDRQYRCNWEGPAGPCTKSYGTLNHLNAHVTMQGHGAKRTPGEFKEMRKLWRKQKKETVADDGEGEDGGSSGGRAGPSRTSPSTSLSPSSSRSKRKRRATEPVLPNIATLEGAGPPPTKREEDYARTAQRHQAELEMSRRVSMDEYHLGSADRRGSAGSGDGDTTQGEDAEEESSAVGLGGAMGPMQSAEHHAPPPLQQASSVGSPQVLQPLLVPMSAMSINSQPPRAQFWQQQSQQQHHPPPPQPAISPTTVVAPHPSHLPGPGPLALHGGSHPSSHQRHLSYPSSAPYPSVPPSTHALHPSFATPAPQVPHSQGTMGYAPHTPPQQQSQSQYMSMPQQATSSPHMSSHHYAPPAPPRAVAPSVQQRLQPGDILLTPLPASHPHHRPSYQGDVSSPQLPPSAPPNYGNTGGAVQQRLPPAYELGLTAPRETELPPPVQQVPQQQWGESFRPGESYGPPPPLTRASIGGYEQQPQSREYHVPQHGRVESYGGQQQRGDHSYAQQHQQARSDHQQQSGHSYAAPLPRSMSYSAGSLDPYGGQRQESSYLPPTRQDSYPSSRQDQYAPVPQPMQQRHDYTRQDMSYGAPQPGPDQPQQYHPMPQGHAQLPPPHHPHSLPPPPHPSMPDPRTDPYGRGHPGPSEGSY